MVRHSLAMADMARWYLSYLLRQRSSSGTRAWSFKPAQTIASARTNLRNRAAIHLNSIVPVPAQGDVIYFDAVSTTVHAPD